VRKGHFKLLVRLVVNTKEYTNLQYILDLLVQHERFELILAKNVCAEETHEEKELQNSLYWFLKSRYPHHIHLLELLFLRFKMYREYADFILEKVYISLKNVHSLFEEKKNDHQKRISNWIYFSLSFSIHSMAF
jgi:hypothetical protein